MCEEIFDYIFPEEDLAVAKNWKKISDGKAISNLFISNCCNLLYIIKFLYFVNFCFFKKSKSFKDLGGLVK